MGERIGDRFRTTDCLCWLSLIFLRRHDVEAVRSLSARALAAATDAKYPMYVAAARAAMAWVAWKDDRFDDVVDLATEALELWATIRRDLSCPRGVPLAAYGGPSCVGPGL